MDFSLALLESRHSVRSFAPTPLDRSIINMLNSEATYTNSHEAGLNFRFCPDDNAPFRGFARSYGMFRNVNNYLACIIDPTFDHALERAGFCAQRFVIRAHAAGLGTCFVGGSFSRAHVNTPVEVYEKIPFVVACGIPDVEHTTLMARLSSRMAHRKVRAPRDFFDGNDSEYQAALSRFPWLDSALRAVASAPSALNAMPVSLKVTQVDGVERIVASTSNPDKYAAELGIAKFNVQAVVPGFWNWGENAPFFPD